MMERQDTTCDLGCVFLSLLATRGLMQCRDADEAGEPVGPVIRAAEAGAVVVPVHVYNRYGTTLATVDFARNFAYKVVRIADHIMLNALACHVASRLPITDRAVVGLVLSLPFAKPTPHHEHRRRGGLHNAEH